MPRPAQVVWQLFKHRSAAWFGGPFGVQVPAAVSGTAVGREQVITQVFVPELFGEQVGAILEVAKFAPAQVVLERDPAHSDGELGVQRVVVRMARVAPKIQAY